MKMPSEKDMHEAVTTRDKSFDGRFFYGVITTGIFCRPSCTSRRARAENLRFFPDTQSALSAGFRPCKRCRPVDVSPTLDKVIDLARYIEAHADERLTLEVLAKHVGLSPSRVQRVFKSAFGVSPRVYQDTIRMRRFKSSLREGSEVTDAIFASGYGSVSRVYGEQARHIGMTPRAYRAGGAGETIAYVLRSTALGPLLMAATDKGVCFVQFGEDEDELLGRLRSEFPNANLAASSAKNSAELEAWMEALDAHISRGGPRPDLPLDMHGTAFQILVWRFLLGIEEGDVISYGELAAGIGKPKAARAAASACAANRIGVLVPCHRVLRGDGGLGGYRWGVERKRALLDADRLRKASKP